MILCVSVESLNNPDIPFLVIDNNEDELTYVFPCDAHDYALNTLEDRWLEAEPIILHDPDVAWDYMKDVIGEGWPEFEPIILKENDPELIWDYIQVSQKRWPEAEKILIKDNKLFCLYMQKFMRELIVAC